MARRAMRDKHPPSSTEILTDSVVRAAQDPHGHSEQMEPSEPQVPGGPSHGQDPFLDRLNWLGRWHSRLGQGSDRTKSWPMLAQAGWARCTRPVTLGSNGSSRSSNATEFTKPA